MGWFNLGKRDRDGKQVRIEHRDRNLRVSRTGGISLRAQTKAAGLNLTANSQHGVRVSRSLARNTQMALQNGRLVLRGRYGSGPTKLNMSKSGFTVSSKNQLGSFNWVKPGRSSAKLFGVQVRGRKAANAHLAFMLVSLLVTMTATVLGMLLLLLQWLMALGGFCWRALLQIPERIQQLQQWFAVWQLQRARAALPAQAVQQIAVWPAANKYAAAVLIILGWAGESIRARQLNGFTNSMQVDIVIKVATRQAAVPTGMAPQQSSGATQCAVSLIAASRLCPFYPAGLT